MSAAHRENGVGFGAQGDDLFEPRVNIVRKQVVVGRREPAEQAEEGWGIDEDPQISTSLGEDAAEGFVVVELYAKTNQLQHRLVLDGERSVDAFATHRQPFGRFTRHGAKSGFVEVVGRAFTNQSLFVVHGVYESVASLFCSYLQLDCVCNIGKSP